jgi:hypothetical protein
MTALLAMILKLQLNLTTTASFFLAVAFGRMDVEFEGEIAPLPDLDPQEEAVPQDDEE